MNLEERQALLDTLLDDLGRAFRSDSPKISIAQSIIFKLISIPKVEKPFFGEFVRGFKNRLFESGVDLPGLNLNEFTQEKEKVDDVIIEGQIVPKKVKGYFECFSDLIDCLKDELETLKNYFLLRLSTENSLSYVPLLIYEEGCFYQPLSKKLQDKFGDEWLSVSIENLKNNPKEQNLPDSNFIAILMLSTTINEVNKISDREQVLKIFLNNYEEVYHLSPKTLQITKPSDIIVTNDIDVFLHEVKYVTSIFLRNAELSNEEEKIIKKLFHDANCPILEYKVLKGGKSGSKVIEIKPKRIYATDYTKRFIVKFGNLDDKKKIFIESSRFSEHIEYYSVPNYQKNYASNSMVEAIKYIYASQNSIVTSYSFANILNDLENKFYLGRKDIIDEIFSSTPFDLWKQSTEKGKYAVSYLYNEYIKPDKFFENVKKIKGINDNELNNEAIFNYFNKIFALELETNIKVCHGDLHTENFFKDGSGTYLIDFGFTNKIHSIIDHTSLECSVKFKHIPFYISLNDLQVIEEQLLSPQSFNPSFEVSSKRKDILDYYELVKMIRTNSQSYVVNQNSPVEYFISLFIITCRNVQYSDLNQVYALESAEILGRRLMQLI